MRLGVFFIGNPRSGGLYQYSLNLLDSLRDRRDRVIIFNLSGGAFPAKKYRGCFAVSRATRTASLVNRWRQQAFGGAAPGPTAPAPEQAGKSGGGLSALFLKLLLRLNRVDLAIYTAPTQLALWLDTPFIMPVHDLQHRLNPQFPEVAADGLYQAREYLYSRAIAAARAILVDSETGKEDVLNFYPAEESKVKVLPFTPPGYLSGNYTREELDRIRTRYRLPPRFLFYPANFWPHKNHRLIIEALRQIREQGLSVPLVLVGAAEVSHSAFPQVMALVDGYGLKEQVHYLGYVSNEDMGGLYRLAEALVMPTFFGPTNIPYLEAFATGCPVIGADIRGVREQIGDAGLLVDVNSPADLASAILKIWNDSALREDLIEKGFQRARQWDSASFAAAFNRILDGLEV